VISLACQNLSKSYGTGNLAEAVLRDVNLTVRAGEACVLLGPSGSGKTTLLSILGCLLSPSAGEVHVAGQKVQHDLPSQLAELRRRRVGFVFQQAQLLPFLSLEENVRLPGRNAGLKRAELDARVDELFSRLEMEGLRRKRPAEASGGQRQRVAIARALVHRPSILLADEPTAALDGPRGEEVVGLLIEQARRDGAALLTVTHDTRLVPRFSRTLVLDGGRLSER
jgi:putative ABC transport system ATP-binding protein